MAQAITMKQRWEFLMARAISRSERWEFLMARATDRFVNFVHFGQRRVGQRWSAQPFFAVVAGATTKRCSSGGHVCDIQGPRGTQMSHSSPLSPTQVG